MKKLVMIVSAAMIAATPLKADPKSPLPTEEELQQLGEIAQGWMRRFADQMSPMVEQLKEMVDDLNAYEAPEMLPNGDIIIRRKPEETTADEERPSISL